MELKEKLYEIEETLQKNIEEVSDYIFKNPELGCKEYKACEYLIKNLNTYNLLLLIQTWIL